MSIISDINNKYDGNDKQIIKYMMCCFWRFISPLHLIFLKKKLHHCNPLSLAEKSLPHFFVKHVGSEIMKIFVQALLKNMFLAFNTSITLSRRANICI